MEIKSLGDFLADITSEMKSTENRRKKTSEISSQFNIGKCSDRLYNKFEAKVLETVKRRVKVGDQEGMIVGVGMSKRGKITLIFGQAEKDLNGYIIARRAWFVEEKDVIFLS